MSSNSNVFLFCLKTNEEHMMKLEKLSMLYLSTNGLENCISFMF